jgi:uncharacterized protein (TIGR00297 family)
MYNNAILGGIFAVVISILSYKLKFLTKNGSVATFFLAWCIYGFGGIKWTIPIVAFFLSSSMLSKLLKNEKSEVTSYFEKSDTRDSIQVLVNGGIGGILVIINFFFPNEILFIIYCGSLSAVCSDTWATEIGTFRKTNTYNVISWKKVTQGISGGISVQGTLAAIFGSLFVSLTALFWIQTNLFLTVFLITVAGVFGSFADSILGASLQRQNRCFNCGKITERKIHCNINTGYESGLKWMNNDFVNLFASFTGGITILIFHFIGFRFI